MVLDQPWTIGALPVAVAQAEGIMVGYLPGLPCAASPTPTRARPKRTPETRP